MRTPIRRFVAAVPLALAVAGCSAEAAPTATPAATASTEATVDAGGRVAYSEAICPIFLDIAATDPRLAALRAAGSEGGTMRDHADEIDAVSEDLRNVLSGLGEVPDWEPGRPLQVQLTNAIHAIRAQLLVVSRDPDAVDAAATLAAIPYVATLAVDRAMARAVEGGLACADE